MAMLTRGKLTCPVYGVATELPSNQLPTIGDVMRSYAFLKADLPKNTSSTDVISQVASKVAELWLLAGIPTVTVTRIRQRIESLHQHLRNVMKKKGVQKETAISAAQMESLQLFDVASCSCSDFTICTCQKESKVPVIERQFLQDQRNARTMLIGGLDKEVTRQMEKSYERASKRQKYYETVCSEKCHEKTSYSEGESEMNLSEPETSADYCSSSSDSNSSERKSRRNLTKLPTLARECDRYSVSNTAGAAIATAALVDYGIITETDSTAVIDRSKLRREREKLRTTLSEAASTSLSVTGPTSLYFDGRKDKTICLSSVNSKCFITEEHITLLEEPNSVYLGHVTPESGSSKNILSAISDFFGENNTSLNNLQAIGCDGTNVNTGVHRGVIRQLELQIGRPLQWLICLFHCNELPLRHLMIHLDGTTSGPDVFSGNIGKALPNCNELPVVTFEARRNNLPDKIKDVEVDSMDISKDQKYLYDFCRAIETGHVTEQLARREPGTIAHSRWLTTANRILRLYVSTVSPTAALLLLTDYILQVYAPVWFSVKLESQCYKGAKHLWLMASLSRFLPPEARSVVDQCIQRNGFYGHPENVLLSMVADDRPEIRELAVRRIKKARQAKSTNIRKFVLPKLNLDAEDYHSLVNWQECPITEPPLLMSKSDDDIESAITSRQCGLWMSSHVTVRLFKDI